MTQPVFSRRAAVDLAPEGTGRTYSIAPLTYLERQAYRADMTRRCGPMPTQAMMLAALRTAVREAAPGNAAELLAIIAAYEETPDDEACRARLAAIEAVALAVPVYAEQRSLQERHLGMIPYIAAQHALRGWSGEGLPPFRRDRGIVPDDLMEVLPEDDLLAIGWRAFSLMQPSQAAEGNSAPPSPSPSTPETSPAA